MSKIEHMLLQFMSKLYGSIAKTKNLDKIIPKKNSHFSMCIFYLIEEPIPAFISYWFFTCEKRSIRALRFNI